VGEPERAERPARPAHDVVQGDVQPRVRSEVDVHAERVAAQRAADGDAERVRIGHRDRLDPRPDAAAGVRRQRRHPPAPAVGADGDDDEPPLRVDDPPVVALEGDAVRALRPPEGEVGAARAVRAQQHG
jgi:hypothetical protein